MHKDFMVQEISSLPCTNTPKKNFTNPATAIGWNTFDREMSKCFAHAVPVARRPSCEEVVLFSRSQDEDSEFKLLPPAALPWQHPGRHRHAGEPLPDCHRGELLIWERCSELEFDASPYIRWWTRWIRWWTRWRSPRRSATRAPATWSVLFASFFTLLLVFFLQLFRWMWSLRFARTGGKPWSAGCAAWEARRASATSCSASKTSPRRCSTRATTSWSVFFKSFWRTFLDHKLVKERLTMFI